MSCASMGVHRIVVVGLQEAAAVPGIDVAAGGLCELIGE